MKSKFPIDVIFILIFIFNFSNSSKSQNLAPGDIAFIGFNSDNPDGFAFVLLADIPSGEIIHFTENGWLSTGGFRSGEGTIIWENNGQLISAGTVITINDSDGFESSHGNVNSGGVSLAEEGDQIIAYQTNGETITNLSAIHFKAETWDSNATDANTSALPFGLTNNQTALAVGNFNNAIYVGDFSGTKTELQNKIYNAENWYSNAQRFVLKVDYFPWEVIIYDGDWNTSSNWFTNTIPDASKTVIIPEGFSLSINGSSTVSCKNLVIYPDGTTNIASGNTLNVNSNIEIKSRSITKTGNLINKGTVSVSGVTTVERYIPTDNWHIISSPVNTQPLGNFVIANKLDSFTENGTTDYDLAPFNESTNTWGPYSFASIDTSFSVGKGYSMRKLAGFSDETITFTGDINTGNYSIPVTRNNLGWNCIGNPYTSSINIANTSGFLDNNLSALDENFAGIYLWDESLNDYVVITKSAYNFNPPGNETIISQNNISLGQGFFIKAKQNGSVNFTPALQNTTEPSFKSGDISWPAVKVLAAMGNHKNFAIITFNDRMTEGIDPMYDAGKYCGNPDIAMYTKINQGSELKLAVQALPFSKIYNTKIPVEIDCTSDGELVFSIQKSNISENIVIYLEDVKNNLLHNVSNGESVKTIYATNDKNRFLLYFTTASNTKLYNDDVELDISMYYESIDIKCNINKEIKVQLYGIDGKLHLSESFFTSIKISKNNLKSGTYLLKVRVNNRIHTHKLSIQNI